MKLVVYKVVKAMLCSHMGGNPYWIHTKLAKLGEVNSTGFSKKEVKNCAEKFLMADLENFDFYNDESWAQEDWIIRDMDSGKPLYLIRNEEYIPF